MKNRNLWGSFRYAFCGLWYALRTERNSQIGAAAIVATAAAGLLLGLTAVETALLLLAASVVLIAEMLNTAIEATIDLAAPYIDPLAGRAKDVAAGAVLISIAAAVVVGLLVLGPHLLAMMANLA